MGFDKIGKTKDIPYFDDIFQVPNSHKTHRYTILGN